MLRRLFCDLATVAACAIGLIVCSSELFAQQDYQPKIAAASGDAELALKGFVVPEDMSGRLIAAEPMLANPVCFTVTNDGRIFVCETFRQEVGVEDNRNHMNWLENDLQLESVEERAAMFQELNRLNEVERKYNTLYQENNKFLNSIQLSKEGLREQGRKMAVEKAQAVREAEYFKQRDESTQLANSSLKDQNRILEDRLKQAETRLEEFEAERREKGIPAVTNDDPIVLETMDFVNGMYRQFNVLQTPRHEPGNQEF